MSKNSLIKDYYNIEKEYKEKYGEKVIVFMQKGKFYELYSSHINFKDFCNDILCLTCTKTNKNKDFHSLNNPYMAGFQTTFIDRYINILLEKNYNIVIVDETHTYINNSRDIKNRVISRNVTKVISPSTYLDNIKTEQNNFLCIYLEKNKDNNYISISTINLSYNSIILYTEKNYNLEDIKTIILKYNPNEIKIVFSDNEKLIEIENIILSINNNVNIYKEKVNSTILKISYQNEFLNKIYKNNSIGISPIEDLNLEKYPLTTVCLIYLIQFCVEHDSLILNNFKKPLIIKEDKILELNYNCIDKLYINDLIKYIDNTSTQMGKRYLSYNILNPSNNIKVINNRYNLINYFKNNYKEIDLELKKIKDIDKIFRKLCLLKYNQYPTLYDSLNIFKNILNKIEIKKINKKFNSKILNELLVFLEKNININNNIDTNFFNIEKIFNCEIYEDLDNLYDELWNYEIEYNNIKKDLSSIINDKISYKVINNNLYFIVDKKASEKLKNNNKYNIKKFPTNYRIFNDRTNEISEKVILIKEDINILNKEKLYNFSLEFTNKYKDIIFSISDIISKIDFYINGCKLLDNYNFNLPILEDKEESFITIEKLRHPLIEKNIDEPYISNNINLNKDLNGMLLYGVNFSGKSSLMRSVGISIILAQSGLPVPCNKMNYYPFKKLITKICLGDDYNKKQSTFTNEIKEINKMINFTNNNSIILADELCSGTEIFSAISLVAATILNLIKNNCKFIFTTHFHQLLDIEEISSLKTVKPFHLKVYNDNGFMKFDRTLHEGKCDDSYGIEIASYMNLPKDYIYTANLIRNRLKNKTIVNTKTSRYNKDIYMTECENCKTTFNLHTHHIIPQSIDKSINKNNKNNLSILCEKCHINIHSTLNK